MNRYFLTICFFFLSATILLAQNKKAIYGTLTDASTGEALIGASIMEKGTQNGTVSDFDGNFELEISGNTIVVSYVGYTTREITVNTSGRHDIKMEQNNIMDELVVVGYQVMKKRDVLGAVGRVDGRDLSKVPTGNAVEALQGRISGVNVSSVNGAPGSGTSIRIRGIGSVNSSNEPLYIIDGVASESGLDAVSPNDIESISVLKDASASIYGARATNGVVIVTTKSGKKGKRKVSYNGQIGFQTHPGLPKMVNTRDYITLYNEAKLADDPTPRPFLQGDYLNNLADVDHLGSIFRTALLHTHELSVSGGTEKLNYLLSGTYYDQEGIIKNSGNEKVNLRANLNYQMNSKIKFGLNLLGGQNNTTYIPSSGDGYGNSEGGSVVRYAFFRNPAVPIYNSQGGFVDKPSEYFGDAVFDTFFGDGYPPLGIINNTNRERIENIFNGSATLNIQLLDELNWKTVYGLFYTDGSFNQHNRTWGTANRINNPENFSNENYKQMEWTFNSVLNYNKVFDNVHSLNALAGVEAVYNGLSGDVTNYLAGLDEVYTEYKKNSSLMSFFGSVNYNYNQKYFISALMRRDGSSKFTKDNRWGNFFSVFGGWNLDSEDFVKNLGIFDVLKLRAGYGTMGNEGIDANARYKIIRPNFNYPFGGEANKGYAVSKLGNEDLTWETSKQLNVGLDMAFMSNSLGFSIDYYRKISENMLLEVALPPSVGYASGLSVNDGEMLNTGIDVEVFFRKDFKDKGFSVTWNGGYLKNEVLSISAPMPGGRVDNGIYAKLVTVGQSIGSFYLYEMDGIFQNQLEVLSSAYQGIGIKPGDVKYKDISGPNGVPDGEINAYDRTIAGTSIPKFTTGLNLTGYWKNFDLAVFFQGAFGHKNYIQLFHDIEGFYRGFGVTQRYFDNRWTGEGTSNTQPRASWSAKSNNVRASTRFLENASYLRIKNLQIGYNVNSDKVRSLGISSLRIFLAATNLFTFTSYPGIDPEMTVSANSTSEGDRSGGIDWGTYPIAKSYTFGLNITF